VRSAIKTRQITEFGDFQTPEKLARDICSLLFSLGIQPKTILEPTCGIGNFLSAALERFPSCRAAIGLDISSSHLEKAHTQFHNKSIDVKLIKGDFFETDWQSVLENTSAPLLIIGNPPWVTNSQLSVIEGTNAPQKTNFQNFKGYDALTGKSNFDISEWMLIHCLRLLDERNGTLAMICKTSVARKLLTFAWKNKLSLKNSSIYHLDALNYFGVSVQACLLICEFAPFELNLTGKIFDNLSDTTPLKAIGYYHGDIITSIEKYKHLKHLRGDFKGWRSGIKHDCSKVMELVKEDGKYRNGFGEIVDVEQDYLYQMLKGSDVANSFTADSKRRMLVTQKFIGEDTDTIKDIAPKTWGYLAKYADLLNKRRSSIYRKRPQFSIFGVGDYSFTKWKIAIAGLYKKLDFKVVGSDMNKPIVFDDTVCFIPCLSKEQAEHLANLLNSKTAKEFFEAFIFWDSKRPITIDVLRKLDLNALEEELKVMR